MLVRSMMVRRALPRYVPFCSGLCLLACSVDQRALTLATGESVKGFLCEPAALAGAIDITAHGGWRAFLKSRAG